MSSLEQDTKSGRYRLRFRFGGTAYKRSLKTTDKRRAEIVLARVEETIGLLERGRLELPPDADRSGKVAGQITIPGVARIEKKTVPACPTWPVSVKVTVVPELLPGPNDRCDRGLHKV